MNRIKPSALEVERSVLGSLLVSPPLIHSVIEKLPESAFYGPGNAEIYKAIIDMEDNEGIPNIVSLAEYLKNKEILDRVGGEAYLSELVEDVNTRPNIDDWVNILNELSTKRKLIKSCSLLINEAFQPDAKIQSLASQLDSTNEDILNYCVHHGVRHRKRGKIVKIDEVWSTVENYYEAGLQKEGYEIVCWPKLSKLWRFVPGLLNIIGGMAHHGKTTFMGQVITDTIMNHNTKWAIFSPENLPYYRFLKPISEKITGKSFFGENGIAKGQLDFVYEKIRNNLVFIEPNEHNRSLKEVIRLIKLSVVDHGCNAVLIDPWNKIKHEWSSHINKTDYIGDALTRLQGFARENNTWLGIAVHPQKMYKKPGQKNYDVPTTQDLKDSNEFANASDMIITIYRNYTKNFIEAHVQKIKFSGIHGDVGLCYLRYNKYNTRLTEISEDEAKESGKDSKYFDVESDSLAEQKAPEGEQVECWQNKSFD